MRDQSGTMTVGAIAERLVALCRDGDFSGAYDELFSEDARAVEMPGGVPSVDGHTQGLQAMRAKSAAWMAHVRQWNGMWVGAPTIAGNWFCVPMSIDVTHDDGKRMQVSELCLYLVRHGTIVAEQVVYGDRSTQREEG